MGNIARLFCYLLIFFFPKLTFHKLLELEKMGHFVWADQGPKCLQMLIGDDKRYNHQAEWNKPQHEIRPEFFY